MIGVIDAITGPRSAGSETMEEVTSGISVSTIVMIGVGSAAGVDPPRLPLPLPLPPSLLDPARTTA